MPLNTRFFALNTDFFALNTYPNCLNFSNRMNKPKVHQKIFIWHSHLRFANWCSHPFDLNICIYTTQTHTQTLLDKISWFRVKFCLYFRCVSKTFTYLPNPVTYTHTNTQTQRHKMLPLDKIICLFEFVIHPSDIYVYHIRYKSSISSLVSLVFSL